MSSEVQSDAAGQSEAEKARDLNDRRRKRIRRKAGIVDGEGPNDQSAHLAKLSKQYLGFAVPGRDFKPEHNYTAEMWEFINRHFEEIPTTGPGSNREASVAPKAKIPVAVEVGSRRGAWAQGLLQETQVGQLFCVDPWAGRQGMGNFQAWLKRLPSRDLFTRVHPIHQPASLAAQWFPYEVNLLFLDGLHDKESVTSDLSRWVPLVARGGLILGHDYNQPEVQAAVDQYFGDDSPIDGQMKVGVQHAVTFHKRVP